MAPHETIEQQIKELRVSIGDAARDLKRDADMVLRMVEGSADFPSSANYVVLDAAVVVARIAALAELQLAVGRLQDVEATYAANDAAA